MVDVPVLVQALSAANAAYSALLSGDVPYGYTSLIRADARTGVTPIASSVLRPSSIFGVAGPGVIAIRGTMTLHEWLEDFEAALVPGLVPGSGLWHAGFKEVYEHIRPSILQAPATSPMLIVGHSLGAALAEYAALDLAVTYGAQVRGVTFGGPRAGDHAFSAAFNKYVPNWLRVVNHGDIVPQVPLPPLFWHVGADIPVKGGFHLTDLSFAHHLTTYRLGIERLAA